MRAPAPSRRREPSRLCGRSHPRPGPSRTDRCILRRPPSPPRRSRRRSSEQVVAQTGSNPWPEPWQDCALPTAPLRHRGAGRTRTGVNRFAGGCLVPGRSVRVSRAALEPATRTLRRAGFLARGMESDWLGRLWCGSVGARLCRHHCLRSSMSRWNGCARPLPS